MPAGTLQDTLLLELVQWDNELEAALLQHPIQLAPLQRPMLLLLLQGAMQLLLLLFLAHVGLNAMCR